MRQLLFPLIFLLITFSLSSAEPLTPEEWLRLGPFSLKGSEQTLKTPTQGAEFSFFSLRGSVPAEEKPVNGIGSPLWHKSPPRFTGAEEPQAAYLALYLEADRWVCTEMKLEGELSTTVYLDGQRLSSPYKFSLPTGKHSLIIEAFIPAGKGKEYPLKPLFSTKPAEGLRFSLDPKGPVGFAQVLNLVRVNGLELSPDGRMAALFLSQNLDGKNSRHWMEILSTDDGRILFNTSEIHDITWFPDSRRFLYTSTEKDLTSLIVHDLGDNSRREILTDVADFGSFQLSEDGSLLVYSVMEKKEPKGKGYKQIQDVEDRAQFPRFRSSFIALNISTGLRTPLTSSQEEFDMALPSPKGDKILLLKTPYVYDRRPYTNKEVFLLNLADMRREHLFSQPFLSSLSWSPDGKSLLVIAGPSSFDNIGNPLPKERIPNDYDQQLFLYSLSEKKAKALTKDFNPSVGSAFWSPRLGDLFLSVTDQDQSKLYRYSFQKALFQKLNTIDDSLEAFSPSRNDRAVYTSSGINRPERVFVLDLKRGVSRLLKDYNQEFFQNTLFGSSEDFVFQAESGRTVDGYLVFPPHFDASKKYPLIVNYYGGTTPVSKVYGGRYPKEWYAANGYVVYVVQPSGTVGYGKEFSSTHVNDWGEVTGAEILEGVEKLLKSKPYIDPKRIGAIGASYGGFMTLSLGTRSDRFAALISHAGISTLSSYWGVGDWGYTYSAVATADSFPWNRPDIYVQKSPLFNAQKITTPLLLLHGDKDNNVPPGESYQMFTALKLLGKEVALVTFDGQQHWILEYDKRVQWMKTIMAWFDRFLKDQPEAWQELYPQK